MNQHSVDSAFLHHIDGQSESGRRLRDEIGDRVRQAADPEGRFCDDVGKEPWPHG
jgi:hypothetical protein